MNPVSLPPRQLSATASGVTETPRGGGPGRVSRRGRHSSDHHAQAPAGCQHTCTRTGPTDASHSAKATTGGGELIHSHDLRGSFHPQNKKYSEELGFFNGADILAIAAKSFDGSCGQYLMTTASPVSENKNAKTFYFSQPHHIITKIYEFLAVLCCSACL